MKKLLLTSIITCAGLLGFSQTSNYTAVFSGSKADLDKAITGKSVSFLVNPVKGANDVDYLKQRSVNYTRDISISVTLDLNMGGALVVAGLDNEQKDMKWLFRYFLNANITQVQMDGKSVSTQEFFKPWL